MTADVCNGDIMRSRSLEAYKKTLVLTERQQDILIGLLLGDGCLELLPNKKSARLKLEYTGKQKAYIDWLYTIFRRWVINPPKRKITKAFNKSFEKYWCTTVSSPILKKYFDMFYRNHRKIVPTAIDTLLTPIGLAVWFMDDGSTKSKESKGRILCTHAFSQKEVLFLCTVLREKFFLEAKPRKQKDGTEIYISGHSLMQLRKTIRKYIIPSMRYKLLHDD